MDKDYVYVVLWDGWMFNFVTDSYKYAQQLANELIFPSMRIIKKVYLKNQYKMDSVFVVIDSQYDFHKLFDNKTDAEEMVKSIDISEHKVIEVKIKRTPNIKIEKEVLCTIGDAVNYRSGK